MRFILSKYSMILYVLCSVALIAGRSNFGVAQVLTYHNDNARTGQNTREFILTAANVNATHFGKIGFDAVDGKVDAEPLYVPHVSIGGVYHNVLYVVTEHDSAYAFDADTGKILWHVYELALHETASDARNCDQIMPEIGISSTPVIDPYSGPHGTMYLLAATRDSYGNYYHRLHAIDLTTGRDLPGSPVTIAARLPGRGPDSITGEVTFDSRQYKERAALLLLNHVVYLSWSSHCDHTPYSGWVMGYHEGNLAQTSVLNLTPNGMGGSIWQSGGGPAADSAGNIYFLDANGTFDTKLNAAGFPSQGDYGNAFLKLSTAGNRLAVADYFAVSNTVSESNADEDLGSGGAMLLPDIRDAYGHVYVLALGAGKDGNIYVVDRNNMGKFDPNHNNIVRELPGALGREFGMPAYWNYHVYYGGVGYPIRDYWLSQPNASGSPNNQTPQSFGYPGATPSVSANGTSSGILWAANYGSPGMLYAYDATNVAHMLYSSGQAGKRDQFGAGNKFVTPMIANGKVYVGTQNGVAVFGLLK